MRITLSTAEADALMRAGNEVDAGPYEDWSDREVQALQSALVKLAGRPREARVAAAKMVRLRFRPTLPR